MQLNEICIPEGIIQQIDHKVMFAGITKSVGNLDHINTSVNHDVLYEDTLEDIEKTWGSVPVSMKFLPKKVLIHNWSSWKKVDEINKERARYLLNIDDMFEEILSGTAI